MQGSRCQGIRFRLVDLDLSRLPCWYSKIRELVSTRLVRELVQESNSKACSQRRVVVNVAVVSLPIAAASGTLDGICFGLEVAAASVTLDIRFSLNQIIARDIPSCQCCTI